MIKGVKTLDKDGTVRYDGVVHIRESIDSRLAMLQRDRSEFRIWDGTPVDRNYYDTWSLERRYDNNVMNIDDLINHLHGVLDCGGKETSITSEQEIYWAGLLMYDKMKDVIRELILNADTHSFTFECDECGCFIAGEFDVNMDENSVKCEITTTTCECIRDRVNDIEMYVTNQCKLMMKWYAESEVL